LVLLALVAAVIGLQVAVAAACIQTPPLTPVMVVDLVAHTQAQVMEHLLWVLMHNMH
jgi:hypothetical protein